MEIHDEFIFILLLFGPSGTNRPNKIKPRKSPPKNYILFILQKKKYIYIFSLFIYYYYP